MTSPSTGHFDQPADNWQGSIDDLTPVRPRSRRPRWLLPLVGLLVFAALVGVGAYLAITMVLTGDAGATRAAYAYVPADAMVAVEVRLDLPAGQREQLVEFVRRFPEFEDAEQVETRLTELLDEAVKTASGGRADYATDVEPWFDGWIVAAGSVDPAGFAETWEMEGFGLALMGHHDQPAAEAAVSKLRGAGEWTSTDHAGTTVWTNQDEWQTVAYAVTEDVIVIGVTEGDVELALDTRAGTSNLLELEGFAARWEALPAGRVGALWMDYEAFLDAQFQMMRAIGGGELGPDFGQICPDMVTPTTAGMALSFQDGHAVLDTVMAYEGERGAPGPARDSGLDRSIPGDTFAYFEMRDVGRTANEMLACVRESEFAEELAEIEEMVGPIDNMIGWAGDAAVAVRFDGSRATLGLVVSVVDEVRAAEAMGQLRAALVAVAGSMGSEEVVTEETYAGVRIVRFSLGGAVGETPAPAPRASFSYAFDGDRLIMGIDESFTKAVIDATEATSLRANETFSRSVELAGGFTNSGLFYVDLEAVVRLVDSIDMPEDAIPADVREYLGVFESVVAVAKAGDEVIEQRVILTTNE